MQQEESQRTQQEKFEKSNQLEKMEVETDGKEGAPASIPENLFGGPPSSSGRKKMKVLIRRETGRREDLSIAEIRNEPEMRELLARTVPRDIKASRTMASNVNSTVEKFFKQSDTELDTKGSKKCLNCGSTRVCSKGRAQKTGEPRAQCTRCNKEFPTRYALMFFEVSNPGMYVEKSEKKAEKEPTNKEKKEVAVQEEMSVERATEILSGPISGKKEKKEVREKLAFLYVEGLPRNRIGLIKTALATKIGGVEPGDIVNLAFIGNSMAEMIVYDKVAVMMKEELRKINLKTCEWNPAGGDYGKARFKERMKRIGERKGVPYPLTNLARKLAIAEDRWLEKILAKSGIETGSSTLQKKPSKNGREK